MFRINVVIFYESIEREMQNSLLLKCELRKRGHSTYIFNIFFIDQVINNIDFIPDIVLTPYLYNDNHFEGFKRIFKNKIPRIINLQYEQIFSDSELKSNIQIPKGKKKNAMHICWNKMWQEKLIENDINRENAILTGSLNIDMCRERFFNIYETKENLSKKYKLDKNKKWILIISSMALANSSNEKRSYYYSIDDWGKEKTDERIEIDTKSRDIIVKWIEEYTKENDCEIIYRPHPGELVNNNLKILSSKYKNIKIIHENSIRTWIKNSDKIHTWYSTSITEIYFMNKICSILRPIDLPKSMHSKLLNSGKFIKTYEEFCNFNNNEIEEFPIDKELILEHFCIDENKYAYEKICDLIEELVNKNIVMDLYE